MSVTALAPWFGSNRLLAQLVATHLNHCEWVGVPFAGGMSEVGHLKARTIVVNDLHRQVINLAAVAADPRKGPKLYRTLRRLPVHPDCLSHAQQLCRVEYHDVAAEGGNLDAAIAYFVCCWMGRSGKAGTKSELNGNLAFRFEAGGGDSAVRYQSAVRSLVYFRRVLKRCTFSVMDAFEFILKCKDRPKHGLYCDPPFFGPGKQYLHDCGKTDAEQLAWHARLRDLLLLFKQTRIVVRCYDVPQIHELYPEPDWMWVRLKGRKMTNEESPEVLLIRN